MKMNKINIDEINQILSFYKYYNLANQFKKITSLTQGEIDKKRYDALILYDHGFSEKEILIETLQFIYMMLTDFFIVVKMNYINNGYEIVFDCKIDPNEIQQISLFDKEDMKTFLNRKRYVSIGNIINKSKTEYQNNYPTACMKFKNKTSDSFELLSPMVIDFLATYPIIFYLSDNEQEKDLDICPQVDEIANKHFSNELIPRFKDKNVVKRLLTHCKKLLTEKNEIIEINIIFTNDEKKIYFHKQLAEDIYYSIIYELITNIQKNIESEFVLNIDNKVQNDRAGYQRINKFFFSTSKRKIDEKLDVIDNRKMEMIYLHNVISSGKKFF